MSGLEQPEQLRRLDRFRAQYPGVVINRDGGFGFWQAWIPVSNGGTVITRYVLQDLLAKLDELHAPDAAETSRPERAHSQVQCPCHPRSRQDRMINLPTPYAAARITAFLSEHLCWSAFWDKRDGVWRVSENDPDSDLYAESADAETVIAYMVAHS
jgi:hypothetical protein